MKLNKLFFGQEVEQHFGWNFVWLVCLGILGLLILAEILLLVFWQFLPEKNVEIYSANISDKKYLDKQYKSPAEMEKDYQQAIRDILKYDSDDFWSVDNLNKRREELLALTVPPAYQDFHLQTVLRIDQYLQALEVVATRPSLEQEQKLLEIKQTSVDFWQQELTLSN